jgi:outer membrane protein assembly complex protein YaeT
LDGAGFVEVDPEGSLRFDVTMGVSQVGVVFPEGFRGIYDGALRLEGNLSASTLSGRLSLERGLYDRDFEVGALSTGDAREVERTVLAELPRGVSLDVEIEGSDDVWMRNNTGRLEAGVSLRVGGELRDPRLTGRILLYEGGRLVFRDVNYRLLSGSLEFDGNETVDPFVEIRAETRVGDYDVQLRIAGRLASFSYELSSYPPLPESDIISLLLTGQVPAASTGPAGSGGSTAPGGLAADYFAGVLTGGVARQLERTLRLDQFRINPLLESGSDPTARVTLGKQVTDRVRILYSVDVGGAGDDRYFVEWEASRRWRLAAESDTSGVYVGSVQFTDRYGREGARESPVGGERTREYVLLGALEIPGLDPDERSRLRQVADLEPGATVRRSEVFQAAESVRRALARDGWIDARVQVEIAAEPDGARVVFQVRRGVRTEVSVEGLQGRLQRAVRKSLGEWLQEGIAGPDLAREASEVVLEELQVRGHYAADVVAGTEPRGEDARVLRVVVDPGPVVRASAVVLEGVTAIPEERVRRQILTGRTAGLKTRPISPAVLEEDARAISVLYRTEGYLDAEVERPLVRLGIDGEKGEVRFVVHEGSRSFIRDVTAKIEGPVAADDVVSWTGLTPGAPVSSASLGEADRKVRSRLDGTGFAEARVEVTPKREDGGVTVLVSVVTGPRMLYAGTVVEGNFRTRDKIVLRESPFAFGEPISGVALREFQHRLYRLGVFRSVRAVPERAEDAGPDAFRVRVSVEEAKPLGVNVGLGYDTDAGPQVSFGAGHDNLGGFDRSLSFQTRWSSLERRVQVVGRDPWLFGRQWDTTATYFWESLEEVGYDLRRNSLAFRVQRRLRSNWTRFVRYNFQQVDVEILDPTQEVIDAIREQKLQNLRLGDVGLAFARDTRDDSFLPTRGGYVLGEARVFGPAFLSERSFVKVFLQGSTTHTFRRGPAYAASVRIGAAKTYGSTEAVPLSERFFAGGTSTLRGFERDGVGLVVEGVPIGGEGLLLINQEVRWPLWRSLSLVTFTDWGNVYTQIQSFDPTDLRYTAGVGLRLATPIGPLRFEYGRKLDRRPGESPGEFYFAVGTIY